MAATFEQAITEIKQRADIGTVIGRSVKLKRSGTSLVGLCPFHNEKTPSFYVHPNDGFFKCFGCDAKGDVFSFLERHTGQSFIDIARGLADEFGVEIPDDRRSPQDQERAKTRDRAMRAAELAQLYFRQCLRRDEGKPGLHYLKSVRGLTDDEIDRWAIGYGGTSTEGLINFLKQENVSSVDARNAGVIASGKHGEYSFYRGRVTFPIRSRAGKVLAFGGRSLGDRGPKYVNGPQSLIYDKSRDLYGLFEALPEMKRGRAGVLVEGYFDVVALGRAGYAAGLSPCGTSLTPRHLHSIERYTDRLVLCLDSDSAGMKGTERALLLLLQSGFKVSLAELLHKDPDDYIKAGQGDVLLRTIEAAKDAFEALVDRATSRAAGSPQRRLRAVEALLPFLAASKDPLTKSHYIRYVADSLKSEMDELKEAVEKRGKAALEKATRLPVTTSQPSAPNPSRPATVPLQPAPPNAPTTRPPASPSAKKPSPTTAHDVPRRQQDAAFDGDSLPNLTEEHDDVFDEALLREARDDSWDTEGHSAKRQTSSTSHPSGGAQDDSPNEKRNDEPKPTSHERDAPTRHEATAFEDAPNDVEPRAATATREPATWKVAEKAMARALLSHPHLAHKAAILVPALRNWELASFISQLDQLVVATPRGTAMDALAQVQIPPRGVFPQLLREIFIARGQAQDDAFMSEDAAVRFIEDFVQTLDEAEVRRALGEIQRAMRNADERDDLDTWKHLQRQQAELVRLMRDVSVGLEAKPPPPTPAALQASPARKQLGPGNGDDDEGDSDDVGDEDLSPAPPAPSSLMQPPPASYVDEDDDDEDDDVFDF